ncbi:efflux RND transporter periplasmic adaptor subunit [Terrimonas alba]|uniref:efflux RND transporter periplasmic adaptor subunit n=1 Tax=Terrimonas alba TaxID=3349636 RepID=UPI0035F32AAD
MYKKNQRSKRLPFLLTNYLSLLFVAVAAAFLYACNSSSGNPTMMEQPPQFLPVLIVNNMPATTYQEFSASLEGSKDIEIRPQVDGYLEKIYVDEGAHVRKGQVLFKINSRPYLEQLNNARATLAAAKASQANAEINVSKLTPLVQNNVISEVQLKTAKTAYDAATANVAQAQAMVGAAQINLGYTTIKAPVDGYIGRIPYKTGSLVGMTTPTALTVISEIKDVYAYFSLSENDFLRFKQQFPGNTIEEKVKQMPAVELVLSDNSVYPKKGKVETVLGQFNNTTGAISFRATFPNTDNLLRSGNTGRVRISKIQKEALVVPQESTFEIQDKVFVFAVGDSNKVVSKPIVVSGKTANYYFVESGLSAGEKIVFSGTGNLKDGMAIAPQLLSTDSLLKAKPL